MNLLGLTIYLDHNQIITRYLFINLKHSFITIILLIISLSSILLEILNNIDLHI